MPKNQGVEDKKVEEKAKEIVLQAYMHCEECANKVSRCLRGFEGVEEIQIDKANNKVIVKGDKLADPVKVLERIRNKYSRNAQLISPKPKPKPEKEKKPEIKNKQAEVKVVIFKMFMHCKGCARDIKKYIIRMEGVLTVETEMGKSQVRVKGIFDSLKLAQTISKGLGKHVEIMKEEVVKKTNNEKDNKKEENHEVIKLIHYPPSNDNNYSCQIFSDENVYSCFIM